jgi:type III secretion protein J
MTPLVRGIVRGAGRAVAAVMLLVLLAGCRSDLYSQLAEDDANEILDVLYATGIEAHKQPVGEKMFSVQVDDGDMQAGLRATRERGLPRQRFSDLGTLFKKEGLVSTPSEERVRFIYGLSQELSSTLTSIDGVISARVHPVIPANDPMADKIKPSSASVFIKHDPHANVQALAPAIKNLVMRGIEGLNADNITLTFVASDPPLRKPSAAVVLPPWLVWVLGGAGGALALVMSVLAFLLWRYRQLAAVLSEERAPAAPAGRAQRPQASTHVPWLRSLWRGNAAWSDKPAARPGRLVAVAEAPNAGRFGAAPVAAAAKPAAVSGG